MGNKATKIFKTIRNAILEWAKRKLIQWGLTKTVGAAAGGFKAWVIVTLISEVWEKKILPYLKVAFREIKNRTYDKWRNNKKSQEVVDAKTEDDWNDAVDNLP